VDDGFGTDGTRGNASGPMGRARSDVRVILHPQKSRQGVRAVRTAMEHRRTGTSADACICLLSRTPTSEYDPPPTTRRFCRPRSSRGRAASVYGSVSVGSAGIACTNFWHTVGKPRPGRLISNVVHRSEPGRYMADLLHRRFTAASRRSLVLESRRDSGVDAEFSVRRWPGGASGIFEVPVSYFAAILRAEWHRSSGSANGFSDARRPRPAQVTFERCEGVLSRGVALPLRGGESSPRPSRIFSRPRTDARGRRALGGRARSASCRPIFEAVGRDGVRSTSSHPPPRAKLLGRGSRSPAWPLPPLPDRVGPLGNKLHRTSATPFLFVKPASLPERPSAAGGGVAPFRWVLRGPPRAFSSCGRWPALRRTDRRSSRDSRFVALDPNLPRARRRRPHPRPAPPSGFLRGPARAWDRRALEEARRRSPLGISRAGPRSGSALATKFSAI
jgi:hypothetical protein